MSRCSWTVADACWLFTACGLLMRDIHQGSWRGSETGGRRIGVQQRHSGCRDSRAADTRLSFSSSELEKPTRHTFGISETSLVLAVNETIRNGPVFNVRPPHVPIPQKDGT